MPREALLRRRRRKTGASEHDWPCWVGGERGRRGWRGKIIFILFPFYTFSFGRTPGGSTLSSAFHRRRGGQMQLWPGLLLRWSPERHTDVWIHARQETGGTQYWLWWYRNGHGNESIGQTVCSWSLPQRPTHWEQKCKIKVCMRKTERSPWGRKPEWNNQRQSHWENKTEIHDLNTVWMQKMRFLYELQNADTDSYDNSEQHRHKQSECSLLWASGGKQKSINADSEPKETEEEEEEEKKNDGNAGGAVVTQWGCLPGRPAKADQPKCWSERGWDEWGGSLTCCCSPAWSGTPSASLQPRAEVQKNNISLMQIPGNFLFFNL